MVSRHIPDVLAGRYRVINERAVGGMGTILEAHDAVLDRRVALKILRDEFAADADVVERFRQEAQIAGRLHHPNIAQVFDFQEDDGVSFIVMELLEGSDLHAVLADGPLDAKRVKEIAAAAASGLGHAHRNGAVHRDIKPGNIFITNRGEVKITDFGIATAAGAARTTAGAVLGTPFYLSPEQVTGQKATPASDVYAMGCVMFEMLTGSVPFPGEQPMEIARAHLDSPTPRLRDIRPETPRDLDEIIFTAMNKDPSRRFLDGQELADALRSEAGPATTSIAPAGPQTMKLDAEQVETKPGRTPRRKGPVIAVILLAALVAAALFASALVRNEVQAPSLVSLSIQDARAAAKQAGVDLEEETVLHDAPQGTVVDQSPVPGTETNGPIKVKVSDGRGARVPDVRGMELEEAGHALEKLGLRGAITSRVEGREENIVTAQVPDPGSLVTKGSVVGLAVTKEGGEGKRGKGKDREDD